jgi:pimeloyl-ACP methyl ester carboxylesterase
MALLWRLLALALAAYGILCLLVVLLQRRLMYFPDRAEEARARQRAEALGLRPWRDATGALIGWRPERPAAGPRVLVFHGNAGSALDRVYYLDLFEGAGAEVLLFEYPGYGSRPGQPSQDALVAGALAAVEQLRREDQRALWLLGESLGSGVAAQVATRRPRDAAGLVLVTPFASMSGVAAAHYPFLPVRLLLRDRWDSSAALGAYAGPVGLVIAGRDEVVGAAQGRLLASSLGARARVWVQPEAGHNSWSIVPELAPWPEVRAFLLGDPSARPLPNPE